MPASAATSGSRSLRRSRRTGLGVVGERNVRDLADLVPAAQDGVDVLVALEEEDGPLALRGSVAERLEHRVVVGRDGAAAQVARAQPELVPVAGDPLDRNAVAPEAPHDREPGVEQPVDDRRPHASTSSYAAIVASVTAGQAKRSLIRSRAAAPRR